MKTLLLHLSAFDDHNPKDVINRAKTETSSLVGNYAHIVSLDFWRDQPK
jgi:hypothetical protein